MNFGIDNILWGCLMGSGVLIFLMKKGKLIVRFILVKAKMNKQGKAPIYCWITYNGKRATDFSTGKFLEPKRWDGSYDLVKGRSEEAEGINQHLTDTKREIEDIYVHLRRSKEFFTANTIRNLYLKSGISILEVYEEYNEQERKGKKEGTTKNYGVYKKLLADFLEAKRIEKITILQFGRKQGERFRDYLLKERALDQNYASKAFSHLIGVFNYAVRQDYLRGNPMEGLRIKKRGKIKLIYLDQQELRRLEHHRFESSLQKIADLFLIQCYTGLAYADLKNLSSENFYYKEEDDRYWIRKTRQKVAHHEAVAELPLLEKPLEIIERWGGLENLELPVPVSQLYNRLLKQIAYLLEIKKPMTTHLARHTFAMMALNTWGISMDTVAAMMGHKKSSTTRQFYAKVTQERIQEEMKNIR